jgi:hypothetical protein
LVLRFLEDNEQVGGGVEGESIIAEAALSMYTGTILLPNKLLKPDDFILRGK